MLNRGRAFERAIANEVSLGRGILLCPVTDHRINIPEPVPCEHGIIPQRSPWFNSSRTVCEVTRQQNKVYLGTKYCRRKNKTSNAHKRAIFTAVLKWRETKSGQTYIGNVTLQIMVVLPATPPPPANHNTYKSHDTTRVTPHRTAVTAGKMRVGKKSRCRLATGI